MSGRSVHSSTSENVSGRQKKKRVTTRAYYVRSVCPSYITITECTGVVDPVALVARTHVAAERVGAVAVLAQVVVFLALVDVFQDHLSSDDKNRLKNRSGRSTKPKLVRSILYRRRVRSVPRTAGTERLVLFRFRFGTRLASGAPSLAHRTTARGLRHRRAHLVMTPFLTAPLFYFHVTAAFPLV